MSKCDIKNTPVPNNRTKPCTHPPFISECWLIVNIVQLNQFSVLVTNTNLHSRFEDYF